MIDFDKLKEDLTNKICIVKFTKVNGEERTMRCTLMSDMLPLQFVTVTETKNRKVNEDIISVFDLEKNGWRSFRKTSLIDWSCE